MGTDDIFKHKRGKLQERKKELRTPKPNSYLIVSEGKKTEPLYFDGLAEYINQKYGNRINTAGPTIDTCGEGMCTVSLVEKAAKIVARSVNVYSQIWVVFDKDDFDDFDKAIDLGINNYGYKIAWSNQSFEYWLYLHFNYSDSALHRDVWEEKLNEIFKTYGINKDGYKKNDPNIFSIVTTNGSLKSAISNSIRINEAYDEKIPPSLRNPCTKVHELILELKPYIEELL